MRCGCLLRNLVCSCALALALLPVLAVGGCGPIPIDASFQPNADENILGTLVDDRGSFTFNLNPDTGNIQRIDADNGTITPPTDGQDLSVARDTGGFPVTSRKPSTRWRFVISESARPKPNSRPVTEAIDNFPTNLGPEHA